jgi:ribosomal protein L37AE/L43A
MSEIPNYENLNIYDIYNLVFKKIEENSIDFDKEQFINLFKPYIDQYKNVLNTPIKTNFMKNNNSSSTSQTFISHSISNKKLSLDDLENEFISLLRDHLGANDFVFKILNKTKKTNQNSDEYYACELCNSRNFMTISDNTKICENCGLQINVYMYTVENVGFSQLQHINLNQKYKYEKSCHFKDTINQFQTIQNKFIPDKVFKDLDDMIEKYGLKNKQGKTIQEIYSKVNKQHIRKFLNETGNNKYYEDLQLFFCKITGNKPPDISHLEKNLFEDFNKLVDAFLQISCNTNRKNFLNSQYVLKQLLRRYNYHVKDDDLCMLKTPARIREHDEIYEKCCEILNWNYQPL